MPKSPRALTAKIDSAAVHKMTRWLVGAAILASLVTTIVYAILTANTMTEVHDEGSNPHNSTDTSLTEKEQEFQINSSRGLYFYLYTIMFTLVYIAMKL